MPRFFEKISPVSVGENITIKGENARHISAALRMGAGEELTICDNGTDYNCEITAVNGEDVTCRVTAAAENITEPNVDITLYQCLTKGDKFESIIKSAVQLGAGKIVPVLSQRCVSRVDAKKAEKKRTRYQSIAKSACEQSGRGRIVEVEKQQTLEQAAKEIPWYDFAFLLYEGGGKSLEKLQKNAKKSKKIAIFIGPEGGFDEKEVEILNKSGAVNTTLGKRILRTETAGVAAITAIMLLTGNLE